MEKELKAKAKKAIFLKCKAVIIFLPIFLGMVYVGIVLTTETFPLKTMLYVLILMVIVLISYIVLGLRFISKSHFTYGKIIKIDKNDPDNSLIYQNFIIEYKDEMSNKKYETIVYEQFGDDDDEEKKEIQKFYQDGQKLLNKKVPVLYIPNKPKKTIVFMEDVIKE